MIEERVENATKRESQSIAEGLKVSGKKAFKKFSKIT